MYYCYNSEIDRQKKIRSESLEAWRNQNPDSQDIDFEEYHDWDEVKIYIRCLLENNFIKLKNNRSVSV